MLTYVLHNQLLHQQEVNAMIYDDYTLLKMLAMISITATIYLS